MQQKRPPTLADRAEWLPPAQMYILAHPCRRCSSEPWEECKLGPGVRNRFHAGRMDLGFAHRLKDLAAIPPEWDYWAGIKYHTLPERFVR